MNKCQIVNHRGADYGISNLLRRSKRVEVVGIIAVGGNFRADLNSVIGLALGSFVLPVAFFANRLSSDFSMLARRGRVPDLKPLHRRLCQSVSKSQPHRDSTAAGTSPF